MKEFLLFQPMAILLPLVFYEEKIIYEFIFKNSLQVFLDPPFIHLEYYLSYLIWQRDIKEEKKDGDIILVHIFV